MTIGYIGLGKMGKNMVLHLLGKGIDVVCWNRSSEARDEVEHAGATAVRTVAGLIQMVASPRIIWLMLPAGSPTDEMIQQLASQLDEDDLVIDGSNSFYKDSIRHAHELHKKGIHFMDIGVSGGPSGARNGASLMIGGDQQDYPRVEELIQAISVPDGYVYCGKVGAGHFAKMIHNGIEYGMMEAIAEGASVLKSTEFQFDLASVFCAFNKGSVIQSSLIGWAEDAFRENPELDAVASHIDHTGEGEWTVKTAKELNVPVPAIKSSFDVRVKSPQDEWNSPAGFRNKVVSALRGKFGGHDVMVK
jgi:6-phosphogluconate dehydrogenase